MTITVDTTDRRDGKALALFARCSEWQQGRTKDGRPFFAIPGSERGLLHMTDTRDCSCADRQRSRNVCKHIRAVRFWMAAYQTGAVAPKPRSCATAEDDRIVLTPAGAKLLTGQMGVETEAADTATQAVDSSSRETTVTQDRDRTLIARLIAAQDTHRRTLLASGARPIDDPIWLERDDHIRRLQSKLPRAMFIATP